jgi:hypothetical protein
MTPAEIAQLVADELTGLEKIVAHQRTEIAGLRAELRRERALHHAGARTVRCPTCGAEPGVACSSGRNRHDTHRSRVKLHARA